jgi:hypothetical protein
MSLPKKRGAPLGNKNAYRHGAYAQTSFDFPPGKSAPIFQSGMVKPDSCPTPASPAPPPSLSDLSNFPPPKTKNRLNLSFEIDMLFYYFRALSCLGSTDTGVEQLTSTARTLCILSVTLTRLILTQNWLSRTTGSQVQYTQLNEINRHLQKYAKDIEIIRLKNSHLTAGATLPDHPLQQQLLTEVKQLSRQTGVTVSELLADLQGVQPSVQKGIVPPIDPPSSGKTGFT